MEIVMNKDAIVQHKVGEVYMYGKDPYLVISIPSLSCKDVYAFLSLKTGLVCITRYASLDEMDEDYGGDIWVSSKLTLGEQPI